jgi:hypothetical protein
LRQLELACHHSLATCLQNLIKELRKAGDDVLVVTPCIKPPKEFHGAKVTRAQLARTHTAMPNRNLLFCTSHRTNRILLKRVPFPLALLRASLRLPPKQPTSRLQRSPQNCSSPACLGRVAYYTHRRCHRPGNWVCSVRGICASVYRLQVLRVLGMPLPFYNSPTLLLSLGLSPFVLWNLIKQKPDVLHVASPGLSIPPFQPRRGRKKALCSDQKHWRASRRAVHKVSKKTLKNAPTSRSQSQCKSKKKALTSRPQSP